MSRISIQALKIWIIEIIKLYTKNIITCTKDSNKLIKILIEFEKIKANEYLFIIDTIVIHSNLDTEEETTVVLIEFKTFIFNKNRNYSIK